MKKWSFASALILIVFILVAVGCGSSEPPVPTSTPTSQVHPGKALVSSRCGTCHGLAIVENARYDTSGWKAVVERMVVSGAQLNDDQEVQVIDFLAVTYPKK